MPAALIIAVPVLLLVIVSTVFLYYIEKDILGRLEGIDPEKVRGLLSVTGRANPGRFSKFLKDPGTDDKYILSRIRIYRIVTIISAIPAAILIILMIFLFV